MEPIVVPNTEPFPQSEELDYYIQAIDRDLTLARTNWELFEAIYTDKSSVETVNRTSPGMFHHLQTLLVQNTALQLCRLLDRSGSGNRSNIVLQKLLDGVPEDRPTLREVLEKQLDDAKSASERLRTARNKNIAHNDEATRSSFETTVGFSPQNIIDTIDAMVLFFETFYLNYNRGYRTTQGWGERLASEIMEAQRLAEDYERLVRDGDIPPLRYKIVRSGRTWYNSPEASQLRVLVEEEELDLSFLEDE